MFMIACLLLTIAGRDPCDFEDLSFRFDLLERASFLV